MPSDRLPLTAVAASLRDTLKATFSQATTKLLQEVASPEAGFRGHRHPQTRSGPGHVHPGPGQFPALRTGRENHEPCNGPPLSSATTKSCASPCPCACKSLSSVLTKLGFDAFANWRVIIWAAIGARPIAETLPEDKEAPTSAP